MIISPNKDQPGVLTEVLRFLSFDVLTRQHPLRSVNEVGQGQATNSFTHITSKTKKICEIDVNRFNVVCKTKEATGCKNY